MLQSSASTPAPTPAPAVTQDSSSSQNSYLTDESIASVSVAAVLVLIAVAVCLWKRGATKCCFDKKEDKCPSVSAIPEPLARTASVTRETLPMGHAGDGETESYAGVIPIEAAGVTHRDPVPASRDAVEDEPGIGNRAMTGESRLLSPGSSAANAIDGLTRSGESAPVFYRTVRSDLRPFPRNNPRRNVAPPSYDDVQTGNFRTRQTTGCSVGGNTDREVTSSSASTTRSRPAAVFPHDFPPVLSSDDVDNPPGSSRKAGDRPSASEGKEVIGVMEAVLQSAEKIATNSTIPGISEAASLVAVLVRLTVSHKGNPGESDWRVRWCRSILSMLERAHKLLGKVRRWLTDGEKLYACPNVRASRRPPFHE